MESAVIGISNFIVDLAVVMVLGILFFRTENSLGRQKQIPFFKNDRRWLAIPTIVASIANLLFGLKRYRDNENLVRALVALLYLPAAFVEQ